MKQHVPAHENYGDTRQGAYATRCPSNSDLQGLKLKCRQLFGRCYLPLHFISSREGQERSINSRTCFAGPRTSGGQSTSCCTPCACTWAVRMTPLVAWAMARTARASRVYSCAAMLSLLLVAPSRSTCSASDPLSSPSLRWCACLSVAVLPMCYLAMVFSQFFSYRAYCK